MKRLFYVKDCVTNRRAPAEGVGQSPYFEDKAMAKALRDDLNNRLAGGQPIFVVSRGPDHVGKHGNKIRRMRLKPRGKK